VKVLLVHNYYSWRGGEDECFDAEIKLLSSRGIQVLTYTQHSSSIDTSRGVNLAMRSIWSREDYKAVRLLIQKERPDLTHVENCFPLISPAVYYASQAEGVPVVQSLHNYRLLCLNSQLVRNGAVCEDCLNKFLPWPGVLHSCYFRGSKASVTLASMLSVHRAMKTFTKKVNFYTAPTDFVRNKFIQSGFPEERILLRPIFVATDLGVGQGSGGYALFVGRLSPEKGLNVLLSAWEKLGPEFQIKVVGSGPMEDKVRDRARRIQGVEFLGRVPGERLRELFRNARALILPSIWYEGSPAVIGEAFSAGVPVIASDLGGMSSLIDHGRTGLHFRPGDADDLAVKVRWAFSNHGEIERMRLSARREYETKYTPEISVQRQIEIYQMVTGQRSVSAALTPASLIQYLHSPTATRELTQIKL
jgi:glycosyltransferase involved in cell wall biosynthesis